MSILNEIFDYKKIELSETKKNVSMKYLESLSSNLPLPISFKDSIQKQENLSFNLIAEIKHKSPSKGVLLEDFNPAQLAKLYKENGASAISVLTDKNFFGGGLEILASIHSLNLGIPLLRKDFIFDEYQILEAKVAGASALLLIVKMLSDSQLKDLISQTNQIGLTPLVEVHNVAELERAILANAEVIGINNRNLDTFEIDINTSIELSKLCPKNTVTIAESGIKSQTDLKKLAMGNIDAILVGESLVTAKNIGLKVQELVEGIIYEN
jgi:indole-3-glycerol phosphate synthase